MAQTENSGVQAPPGWREGIQEGLDTQVNTGYFTRRVVGVGSGTERRIYYDPGKQFTGGIGFHQDSAFIDQGSGDIVLVSNVGGRQEWISLDGNDVLRTSRPDGTDPLGVARRLVAEVTGVKLELPQDAPQVA